MRAALDAKLAKPASPRARAAAPRLDVPRRRFRRARLWPLAVTVAAAAALVVPGFAGHPLVSYAASGSMAPTLAVGDGFLVDPLPGELQVGDIVVYSAELREGGLAVHRIVGSTPGGWVTQGDANVRTDQEAGEPYLRREAVRGRVLTLAGAPVVVPSLGVPFIEAAALLRQAERTDGGLPQLLGYGLAAMAVALLLLPERGPPPLAGPRTSLRARASRVARSAFPRGLLARHAAAATLLGVALLALTALPLLHQTVGLEVVVLDGPPPEQTRSAWPGQAVPRELLVNGLALVPTLAVFDAGSHVHLASDHLRLAPGSAQRVVAEEVAGAAYGLQQDTVDVWRYPALLPDEATLAMHRALPGSPLLVPLGLVLGVLAVWYRGMALGGLPARALVPRLPGGSR